MKPGTALKWELCGAMNSTRLDVVKVYPRDSIERGKAINGGEGFVCRFTLPNAGAVEAALQQSVAYKDAVYVVHAANHYPLLVESLQVAHRLLVDARAAELAMMGDMTETRRADFMASASYQARKPLSDLRHAIGLTLMACGEDANGKGVA